MKRCPTIVADEINQVEIRDILGFKDFKKTYILRQQNGIGIKVVPVFQCNVLYD